MTGAAPTNSKTKQYFCSIDILLYEAYGLSETGPIAFNDSTIRNFDTVGNPLDCNEIKIFNPDENKIGEILLKGRSVFMGYLNDPEKTAESFVGDWFKTGDLGRLDNNNDLYIVGRVKELIITSGGENIPFILIEESIKKELPGISNALLIGDKRKYLSILLTIKTRIDPENGGPLDELQEESLQSIQDGIDRYNKKAISNVHTIKKFALLPNDFSMVTGELERDSVGILAFNCPEWFYSAIAAVYAGGIIAGIYTTNSPDAVQHVLETAGSTICIVDNKKQMDKIRVVRENLPKLKTIIQINGPFDSFVSVEDGYYKWSDIEQMQIDNDIEIELEKRLNALVPNECCSLIFTSGTTGKPKSVMLSHDNIIFTVKALFKALEAVKIGEETLISYLPLNHIAAQIFDIFLPIILAGCVYFADRDALKGTLVKTLIKARPTRFLGVPRVWEKIHEKMIQVEANSNVLNSFLLNIAKKFVHNYHEAHMTGEYGNFIAYKTGQQITNKVKNGLGFDKCLTFITGAAPINLETKRYFCSIDILIYDGYGLSEAGLVSLNNAAMRNFVTVGKLLNGIKIKIHNPDEKGVGEILVKSRSVFMGYLNESEKTAETFDDDWYKTGDLGRLDNNNDLYIVGRVKELIITSGGENIPFILIEESIKKELPGISNALLIGDKRKYLTILLTIKTRIDPENGGILDELEQESLQWMEALNLKYTKLSEVLKSGPCPIVLKSIQDGIDRYNKKAISNVHTIKKFALLPHDFSIITGELGQCLIQY
ncbi:very long-chain-fatty-acid--CoA ligase bubblegum-like [Condylostylus longicornis]|uniref:very long-chain-fatty-acid--CoA ligase bubblegum-like n=1 Tax=Condylostylus longicornis TaxID=2530218 RepID=UPI00244E31DF|nr:very long-chain-fatty-acid--CoA ligase bubblegum-like [Condylostylus longicornis]